MFPHHESEIAQSVAAFGKEPCKYWMHNNLVTINGQKMSKSLGNFISLDELYDGTDPAISKAYSPMVLRFFVLQAHYRSTIDFSDEALLAADRGYLRLIESYRVLDKLKPSDNSSFDVDSWVAESYQLINDDLNTARLIAQLFDASRIIFLMAEGKESLTEEKLLKLKTYFNIFLEEILGIKDDTNITVSQSLEGLMSLLIEIRQKAREKKDFTTSDLIRDRLAEIGIQIKDTRDGAEWQLL